MKLITYLLLIQIIHIESLSFTMYHQISSRLHLLKVAIMAIKHSKLFLPNIQKQTSLLLLFSLQSLRFSKVSDSNANI